MKALLYITCVVLLAGCRGKVNPNAIDSVPPKQQTVKTDTAKKAVVFKPYRLNDDYTVIDTGEYTTGPMGGMYAIVKNQQQVDTVEMGFGIQKISKGRYLICSLTAEEGDGPNSDHFLNLSSGNYYIVEKNNKAAVSSLATDFSDYFSSPYVINNKIYYWQIKKAGNDGDNSIAAAEFDPITKKTISHYLFNDDIGSDDSGYFWYPYLKNDTIYFEGGREMIAKFSKEFKPYSKQDSIAVRKTN